MTRVRVTRELLAELAELAGLAPEQVLTDYVGRGERRPCVAVTGPVGALVALVVALVDLATEAAFDVDEGADAEVGRAATLGELVRIVADRVRGDQFGLDAVWYLPGVSLDDAAVTT